MMKNARGEVRRATAPAVVCLILGLSSLPLRAEPLPLRRAVELALSHSTTAGVASADAQRADAAYREVHGNYIPQLTVGSGLGKSWGFPLSLEGAAPSLVNVTANSSLYNASLREGLRAAQAESKAVQLQGKDQRNQVIQDTVVTYAELNKWEQRVMRLGAEMEAANRFEEAVAERVKEGVDSPLDRTKARLSIARVKLRIAEAQGSADVLREHLAKLTGLEARTIETVHESIPAFPTLPPEQDVAQKASDSNPAVESAVEHARAQYLRAKAEHKAFWPSADFATQYARLAKYNNYDQFFKTFEANNATIGVVLRLPIFNAPQRARAQAADAEATKAKKQAEAAKNQVSEETLRLQRSVTQLQAAQEVAQLEYEIAKSNLDSMQTRAEAGTANLHDLDLARTQLDEHLITLQDTSFELERARIALLRQTGELETWAMGGN
jgi:outer membrane protein TolC